MPHVHDCVKCGVRFETSGRGSALRKFCDPCKPPPRKPRIRPKVRVKGHAKARKEPPKSENYAPETLAPWARSHMRKMTEKRMKLEREENRKRQRRGSIERYRRFVVADGRSPEDAEKMNQTDLIHYVWTALGIERKRGGVPSGFYGHPAEQKAEATRQQLKEWAPKCLQDVKDHPYLQGRDPKLIEALMLVYQGMGLRATQRQTGISNERLVYWSKRLHLLERHRLIEEIRNDSEVLVDQDREIALLAGEKLLEKLEDPDEKLTPVALNVIRGTAVDKVAKKERWQAPTPQDQSDALNSFMSRMAEMRGKLKLEVSYEEPETLEVKAEKGLTLPKGDIVDAEVADPH